MWQNDFMNKNLISFLLITYLSGQLYADSTYLFCKADNTLNPGYERVEYTAIELFNNWKLKPDGREYSGGCQREMTYFDKIVSYPKQNIRANFFKGDPYCGKDFGYGLENTDFFRNVFSITWQNNDDLYEGFHNNLYPKQSIRTLNRETLLLKEEKENLNLFSQCEVVENSKTLKRRMKKTQLELVETQIKINNKIKNDSKKNKKTEKQKI